MQQLRLIILGIMDFFYPYFSKVIGKQTFRYLISGGSNAALNLMVFGIGYNFLFKDTVVNIAGIVITSYIAAYILALSICFPIGFILNKYIVFQTSSLKGHVQLFRYAIITGTSIYFDYALLHLFIGKWGFWPTPAQAIIIVLLSLYAYFAQTYFTFRSNSDLKNR